MIASNIKSKNGSAAIRSFDGLNRQPKSTIGEFSDMENMTHRDYPALSSVKGCTTEVTAPEGVEFIKYIIPKFADFDPTKFSGIAKEIDGTYSIYVNGEKKRGGINEFIDAVDFGGAIITVPEFLGYNYVTKGAYSSTSAYVGPFRRSTTKYIAHFGETNDEAKEQTIYVESFPTFFGGIEIGECIAISGCTDFAEENNTWYPENSLDYSKKNPVVVKVISLASDSGVLRVAVYNAEGKMTCFPRHEVSKNGITVTTLFPQISHICVHKNRLWATSKSGEFIYASALGKPLEFYKLNSLATSSWYGGVGTPGKFTGIVSWNNRVIAFKRNSMNIVYGNSPLDFSIEKSYYVGCIDKNSISVVGNSVMWLGGDGFYIFSGGLPSRVSDKLKGSFTSCRAFSHEGKYYAECENGDKTEFLVYDTEKGLWSKLKTEGILGGDCDGKNIYLWNSSSVKKMFSGSFGDFYAETVPMYFDTFDNQAVINLNIRCIMKDNSFLNIYTETDGNESAAHKGISKSGKSKIPIRYKSGDFLIIRFEGSGEVCITDMEMEFTTEKA